MCTPSTSPAPTAFDLAFDACSDESKNLPSCYRFLLHFANRFEEPNYDKRNATNIVEPMSVFVHI